jgi:hypothetical protein
MPRQFPPEFRQRAGPHTVGPAAQCQGPRDGRASILGIAVLPATDSTSGRRGAQGEQGPGDQRARQ